MTGNTVNIRANGALEIPNIVQNKLVQAKSGATTRPFSTLQATSRSPARETTISSTDPIKKIIKIIWAIKKVLTFGFRLSKLTISQAALHLLGQDSMQVMIMAAFFACCTLSLRTFQFLYYNENNFLLTPEFFSSYMSCMKMMCMYHVSFMWTMILSLWSNNKYIRLHYHIHMSYSAFKSVRIYIRN